MIHTCENTPPCIVYVDGLEIKNVVSADTEAGIVIFHPLPLRIAADGQSVVSQEVHGVVKVVMK